MSALLTKEEKAARIARIIELFMDPDWIIDDKKRATYVANAILHELDEIEREEAVRLDEMRERD